MKKIISLIALILSDLFAISLAGMLAILASGVYSESIKLTHSIFNLGLSKVLILVILARFLFEGQYIKRTPFWQEVLFIAKDILMFMLINLVLSFMFNKYIPKSLLVMFWGILLFSIPFFRYLTRLALMNFNLYQRNLILLIDDVANLDQVSSIINNLRFGYSVIGVCVLGGAIPDKLAKFKIYTTEGFKNFLDDKNTEVIAALSEVNLNKNESLLNYISQHFMALRIIPQLRGIPLTNFKIETFYATDRVIIYLENNLSKTSNLILKSLFDLIVSSVLIIVLSPILTIISVLIMIQTKSKPFFLHERIGRAGKLFKCIKFQTMLSNNQQILDKHLENNPDATKEWLATFKLKNDPRVTAIGSFLRKTSLDELPQIFNVFIGQMSLVGPRPIVQKEVIRYESSIYYYHLVRPGVTGLWQVNGRSDTDYARRVYLDSYYVKSWSLWADIVILLRTFKVVLKRDGAY